LFGGAVGGIAQIAGSTIGSLVSTQGTSLPAVSVGPVVSGGGQVMTTAAAMPAIAGMAGAVARITAPILRKIAIKIGKTVSLSKAMSLIRSLSKYLTPGATAAALGITVAELADLIVAARQKPRRRMNPGNAKALRRAMRRLESFHKLCVRADSLRSRGRRPARRGAQTQVIKCA
jgi:hypothetical protein